MATCLNVVFLNLSEEVASFGRMNIDRVFLFLFFSISLKILYNFPGIKRYPG